MINYFGCIVESFDESERKGMIGRDWSGATFRINILKFWFMQR